MNLLCKLGFHSPLPPHHFSMENIHSHSMEEVLCRRCGAMLSFRTIYMGASLPPEKRPHV